MTRVSSARESYSVWSSGFTEGKHNKIDTRKTGLALAAILGLWHLTWSLFVAVGFAQFLIDWVFRLHFIQPPYVVTTFSFGLAVSLIVLTTGLGYVLGWIFASIWNKLH